MSAAEPAVERLVAEIGRRAGRLVVAIDGRSGTGKSTVAAAVATETGAAVIDADDFFSGGRDEYWRTRTPEQRNAEVFDWERLRREAVDPLVNGRRARWHPFDWETGAGLAAHAVEAGPARVVILEGAYTAGPQLANVVDLTVLVTLDEATRHERLRRREGADVHARWRATWDPAEHVYFTRTRPPESFDLVLRRG